MILLHKLSELPRSQRLRKAANLVRGAERRFIVAGCFEAGEAVYFEALVDLLAKDKDFSSAAKEALKRAQLNFAAAGTGNEDGEADEKEIRRSLNTIHHILLEETGRYQADWDFFEDGGILDASKRFPFPGMQVYLEDIRSPFNVGSMFRAADSFGAEKIWLSPLCADPRHKRAERSAMGCVDVLLWERLSCDPFGGEAAAGVLSEGVQTPPLAQVFLGGPFFALETGGIPLEEFPFPSQGLLIAGSEELGVSPRALDTADASLGRVSIPTRGAKGSLNVSVAFGIVMQAWAAHLAKQD